MVVDGQGITGIKRCRKVSLQTRNLELQFELYALPLNGHCSRCQKTN
jgi:hypothetical protein